MKTMTIYKKWLTLLLIASLAICGCTPIKKNTKVVQEETLAFTGLDDEKLQDYVIETLYSGIDSSFTNDDYMIDSITTTYVSKEYLEELDYNTKSNIYFGYNLADLEKQFNGKNYVFSVGKSNETIVEEFEEYEDVYGKMLKNVAIGSGVILVCVTASTVTGGTTSIILAASAKTGSAFATSSAALTGGISSAIEYYETGDIKNSLKKGAFEASESFKWGAIIGSVTGGITEAGTQLSAAKKLKSMSAIERGADAEGRALKKYGGKSQVIYKDGKAIESSVDGSSRPDIVRTIKGKIEAIEVKNYDLNSETRKQNLYQVVNRQVTDRVKNLPKDSTQRIVLDIRGRNYSKATIKEVKKGIRESCKDIYPNIPIDLLT